MKLEIIIKALRDRCPVFEGRVAGAAQFKLLPEKSALDVPCAFVIPLDDSPSELISQTSVIQNIRDSFAVIVAISNSPDERGQKSAFEAHDIRAVLWMALLNWAPSDEYGPISYEGYTLLQLDRSRLWLQFDFCAHTRIDYSDGWQEIYPDFKGADIDVDVISPIADPSIKYPGPDGRIEFKVTADS